MQFMHSNHKLSEQEAPAMVVATRDRVYVAQDEGASAASINFAAVAGAHRRSGSGQLERRSSFMRRHSRKLSTG